MTFMEFGGLPMTPFFELTVDITSTTFLESKETARMRHRLALQD